MVPKVIAKSSPQNMLFTQVSQSHRSKARYLLRFENHTEISQSHRPKHAIYEHFAKSSPQNTFFSRNSQGHRRKARYLRRIRKAIAAKHVIYDVLAPKSSQSHRKAIAKSSQSHRPCRLRNSRNYFKVFEYFPIFRKIPKRSKISKLIYIIPHFSNAYLILLKNSQDSNNLQNTNVFEYFLNSVKIQNIIQKIFLIFRLLNILL